MSDETNNHKVKRKGKIFVCQKCLKGATDRESFKYVGCPDEPTVTRGGTKETDDDA
jgi:hypothetical protein